MKTITSAEYNAWLEHPLTKGLKRSFQQSITDPENQPSQYGTVTLEMYEALESEITTLKSALREAHVFLDHCWRDVQLNDFSFEYLEKTIAKINEVLHD